MTLNPSQVPFVGQPRWHVRFKHSGRFAKSGQELSKRQELHQRCTISWEDLLCRLNNGEMDSVFILCGATAGNLGAILRSCTLLGVSAVCILGGPSRAFLDRAFRFSLVEQKRHWQSVLVPVPAHVQPAFAMTELKQAGLTLVGLAAQDGIREPIKLCAIDLVRERLGFVFGSDDEDGKPFADGVEERLDILATVPMQQFSHFRQPERRSPFSPPDTLNLSVTASIVAYERRRQQGTWWAKLRVLTRSWRRARNKKILPLLAAD